MQRSFATLALFGYLLGGMLLPAMHQHGVAEHDHLDETCCPSETTCGQHADFACCEAERVTESSAASFQSPTPQAHHCDDSCLLCQLSTQVYVAKSSRQSHGQSARTASWKPPSRQLPPISQRRTVGYLRGPPVVVS